MRLLLTARALARLSPATLVRRRQLQNFDVARAIIIGAVPSGGVGGDNNVFENQPTTVQNDNSGTTLSIDARTGQNRRIFVRFDLTGAGISGTVNSAKMRMFLFAAGNNFPRTHSAHRVTSTWLQSAITWNTPTYPLMQAQPIHKVHRPFHRLLWSAGP